MGTAFTVLTAAVGLAASGSVAYLLLLLAAAALKTYEGGRARTSSQCGLLPPPGFPVSQFPSFLVLVPAHNEELVLRETLRSLQAQNYPGDRFRVVVVADNCTDATAEVARAGGGTVLERTNAEERGKGYALDWALSQLLAEPAPSDAFAIVDADTWVAPDFLTRMAEAIERRKDTDGCCALQGRYGVLNSDEGWRAALMAGALDLFNHVRPLGADRLGLSVGLKGNGMAFTREVLLKARWQGRSITEDIDYGLDLLKERGIRVGYVPGALVLAQMPTTSAQAASQRERWEGGRYQLLRERALPLFRDGLRRRDLRLCEAAICLTVPPLAELAGLLGVWGALVAVGVACGWLRFPMEWAFAVALACAGLACYIVGGLAVAGASRAAYIALLKAPFYACWKFALYGTGMLRRLTAPPAGSQAWIRTGRTPMTAPVYAQNVGSENHRP